MPTDGVLIVPKWDLIIVGILVFFAVYSLILQKEKILASIVALYVAIVVTEVWGDKVAAFFMGQNFIGSFWVKANLDPFWVKLTIFLGIIVFFAVRSDLVSSMAKDTPSSFLMILLYSASYTALLATSILKLLPQPTLNLFILQSKLASFLYTHLSWWVILPVALIIIGGYSNKPNHRD
ncbi:hypothetical protein J7K05_01650 [bacterium]|nr:hypothetical protein [bacterium]